MSVSSSFPSNDSLPTPHHPSSVYEHLLTCSKFTVITYSIDAFTATLVLVVLPLCFFVLYLGLKQWRHQCSNTKMSHSDVFTYHMIIKELMGVLGFILMCCGVHVGVPQLTNVGYFLFVVNFSGQMFFHILTCVERYLAVVHPIVYVSLKTFNGYRIRNVIIGCVWLLSFVGTGLMSAETQAPGLILYFTISASGLIITSFCSLSVLRVLIRPGPGGGSGGRQKVDQSKLRAFYTIMVIMGVLLTRFVGSILCQSIYTSSELAEVERCAVWLSFVWFCLPSSLVLPLLFLQRARKLPCWKKNNESGQGTDLN